VQPITGLTAHAYAPDTGEHLFRLPYTAADWSQSYNQPGSMNMSIDYTQTAARLNLWESLRSWKALISLQRSTPNGIQVKHAGPLTNYEWDAETRSLKLTIGGGLTLLTKRLAISHLLKDAWHDQSVLIDEQHPAGSMALTLKGSHEDIIRGLANEAKQWGEIPISLPPATGGTQTMTYYAWDLATIADRITDIINLKPGLAFRLDPRIQPNGRLIFDLTAGTSINDQTPHQWNSAAPGQRIIFSGISGNGANLTSQAWLTGGKDGDKTIMSRRTTTRLTDQGHLFTQSADTTHTTISDLKQLQQYALADLAKGAYPAETYKLKVGEEHQVTVGDLADLRVNDDFMGSQLLKLVITDISGTSSSDWQTLQAVERS
jgi:hypothetical protein